MIPSPSKYLGLVYVWRIDGQAYYSENRKAAPREAEAAKRYLVGHSRDPRYEVISIERRTSCEVIRDAVRVE